MKNLRVFWLLVLAVALILVSTAVSAEEAKLPGPNFHDGSWDQWLTEENWMGRYLVAVNYEKRNPESTKLEMGAELYYFGELVLKTWGVIFHKHEFDYENVQYVIKQENGDWKIGAQGKAWEVIEEQNRIWFFVETESGLKEGRGFPKGDLPEMEID